MYIIKTSAVWTTENRGEEIAKEIAAEEPPGWSSGSESASQCRGREFYPCLGN